MALDKSTRILMQTTIPTIAGDWNIGRFGLVAAHLGSLKSAGARSCRTARCRRSGAGAARRLRFRSALALRRR